MAGALSRPRYYLLGCDSIQARATLQQLLRLDLPPTAVLFDHPAEYRPLPLTLGLPTTPSLAALASGANIPTQGLPPDRLLSWLMNHPPAPLLVSCYPHRIDSATLNRLEPGAFNIHPSRLPAFRGPAPLFWQLRAGEMRMGVSLHRITPQLDQGPLLAQSDLPTDPGDTLSLLSQRAGEIGARLFAGLLPAILSGRPIDTPQPVAGASQQGWPDENATSLEENWTPLRVYNFVNGIQPDYIPRILVRGRWQELKRALAWGEGEPPPEPLAEDQRLYRSNTGWVLLQLNRSQRETA